MPLSRANKSVLAVVAFTILVAAVMTWKIILPAYATESNRTYTSRFGFPALNRQLGRPFVTRAMRVEERSFTALEVGEGALACDRVLAYIVPEGRILAVRVREGDRVARGDILAEVDPVICRENLAAARLALETATAELARVNAGSPVALTYERPEKAASRLAMSRRLLELGKEEEQIRKKTLDEGLISRLAYLEVQRRNIMDEADLELNDNNLKISQTGYDESIQIAKNKVALAEQNVQASTRMAAECLIRAPADGLIERVLVHEGEYYSNQLMRPACIIASGLWFEGRLDQRSLGRVKAGDRAEVELESLQAPVVGQVERIIPIVGFSTGGPELQQPIRPIGTGAPEWPATYRVRVTLPIAALGDVGPGATGLVRISRQHRALAVPEQAVTSISGGKGILHLMVDEKLTLREVTLGTSGGGWTEIKQGVAAGEKVLVEGYQDLEEHDALKEISVAVAQKP